MKQIVVRVTPSRIKFSLCILLILSLAYSTYLYYGKYNEYYHKYNDFLTSGQSSNQSTGAAEAMSEEGTPEQSSVEDIPAEEPEQAPATNASASESLSNKLEVSLTEPLYEIKESGDSEKAVISQIRFIVTNGLSTAQNLLVEIHAYDVDETDENKINARKGGDRTVLPTIATGQSITKTILFPPDQRINLYNLDKAKIIQMDIIDKTLFDDSRETKVLASDKVTITFN